MRSPLPLVALVALVCPGCEPPAPAPPPPPAVTVALPEVRDVVIDRVYLGETRAARSAEVRARVAGFLESIEFEVGQDVAEGDVLFRIERDELEALLEQARATHAISRAEQERAQADFERIEQAAASNAVSQSDVGLARAERDKAAANVQAAQAAVAEAELKLSYADVLAPISGRVDRNLVDVGNLVGATEATLLTTIVELDPLHVYFDVSERELTEYLRRYGAGVASDEEERERSPVAVALEGDDGFPHEGWVDFLSNRADASTGTVELRAIVPNPDLRMYPGLFARVSLPRPPLEDAVLVREAAVGTDLAGKYVLCVGADGTVERRYVEVGRQLGGERVILDGLAADEEYVVEGMVRARPGLPVRVQREDGESAAANGSSDRRE